MRVSFSRGSSRGSSKDFSKGLCSVRSGRKETQDIRGKKVAVFGGTFDPIHKTHLAIIQHIVERDSYDYVIVMPTQKNPLKTELPCADSRHRLMMIHKSINGMEQVLVYDHELTCQKSSYTYDSLCALLRDHAPRPPLGLVLGSDNLERLQEWKEIEKLLAMVEVLLIPRPKYAVRIPTFLEKANVQLCSSFQKSSINSTKIRNAMTRNAMTRNAVIQNAVTPNSVQKRSRVAENSLTDVVNDYLEKNQVYARK